jgi:hypothetical protein
MPRDSDSGVGRRLRRGTVVRHLRLRGCWMLTFVGHPPIEEDKHLYLLVPGGGVGHDRAAVGVADECVRTGDGRFSDEAARTVGVPFGQQPAPRTHGTSIRAHPPGPDRDS